MKSTKQHIQDKALKLFNDYGFVNVRLQHIADAAFVSVGHLAYHFKNKDAIVEALYNMLQKEMLVILNNYKTLPLFEDIDSLLTSIFELQQKYIFFYYDKLEVIRAYTSIASKYIQLINWQQSQYKIMLQFNTARGSLTPATDLEHDKLARLLRTVIDNYPYNCKTEGKNVSDKKDFLQTVWHLLQPHFTAMGNNEFRQLLLHLKQTGQA